MPSAKFALIIRRNRDDEAEITHKGTKTSCQNMLADLVLNSEHIPFGAGVARLVNAEEYGEVLTWVNRATTFVPSIKVHAVENYSNGWDPIVEAYTDEEIAEEIAHCETLEEAIAYLAEGLDTRAERQAEVQEQAPVTEWEVVPGTRLRITPKVGKFQPIVLFGSVAFIDGVRCLVGMDVEYQKPRSTPLDTIASLEAKVGPRYAAIQLDTLGV